MRAFHSICHSASAQHGIFIHHATGTEFAALSVPRSGGINGLCLSPFAKAALWHCYRAQRFANLMRRAALV